MNVVTIDTAKASLHDLIHALSPGDVLTIVENNEAVAQLVGLSAGQEPYVRPRPPVTGVPQFGSLPGIKIEEEFNAPLEELREYME